MNRYVIGSVALLGSVLLLVLLVATGFNLVAVSAGLVAALFVTGERPHGKHSA